MFYMATVFLNMTEEQFWRSTPRKLFALMDCHIEANSTDGTSNRKRNKTTNNKEVVGQIASW